MSSSEGSRSYSASCDDDGRKRRCDSLSSLERSCSPSGRQCGNDFLPDISVQVRSPKAVEEASQAQNVCEFHVMHDDEDDASASQGNTAKQQEYEETLRRLGARRAPKPNELERQVTD